MRPQDEDDDMAMSCLAESERLLDEAIEYSFPASDPIAVQGAFDAACAREKCFIRGLRAPRP